MPIKAIRFFMVFIIQSVVAIIITLSEYAQILFSGPRFVVKFRNKSSEIINYELLTYSW